MPQHANDFETLIERHLNNAFPEQQDYKLEDYSGTETGRVAVKKFRFVLSLFRFSRVIIIVVHCFLFYPASLGRILTGLLSEDEPEEKQVILLLNMRLTSAAEKEKNSLSTLRDSEILCC